jgi:predicted nucleotidyltransferase
MSAPKGTVSLTTSDLLPTGSTDPVQVTLSSVIARLVEHVQPDSVILFGSYAYGTPTPDSDVDLLVVVESDRPYRDRYLWVAEALSPRPFPIDLIVLTPAELRHRLASSQPFFTEIRRRGQVLYERPT